MEKGLRMPLFARLARDSAPPMLIALDISGASTGILSLLSQVVAPPVRKVKVQLIGTIATTPALDIYIKRRGTKPTGIRPSIGITPAIGFRPGSSRRRTTNLLQLLVVKGCTVPTQLVAEARAVYSARETVIPMPIARAASHASKGMALSRSQVAAAVAWKRGTTA